jgi:hypothetical protein
MIRPQRRFIMPRDGRTNGDERAAEIRIEHGVPVFVLDAEQNVVPREAGIVDENVDGAELPLNALDERRSQTTGRQRRTRSPEPARKWRLQPPARDLHRVRRPRLSLQPRQETQRSRGQFRVCFR